MNLKILLFAISLTGLGSCTTAYRSGQTPDDVYYSPAPVYKEEEEIREEKKEEDRITYIESEEDREIRQRIRYRRLRYDDDYYYSYGYHPYHYRNYIQYSYHPGGYYYYNDPKTKNRVTYYPRKYNFNKPNTANVNPKTGNTLSNGNAPVRTLKVNPNATKISNAARRILKTPNTDNTRDNSTPVRTFESPKTNTSTNNSSSSSSSSSSSGSGNAPVRTFNR